jgi:hypothetical protein
MSTNTYVALDKVIVTGSDVATVQFTSIPQGYTDLVIVSSALTSIDGRDLRMRFNSDVGTNYSYTFMSGYTSGTSNRGSNVGYIQIGNFIGTSTVDPALVITQIHNYSNPSIHKASITSHNQFQTNVNTAYTETMVQANLWRSNSAITSITMSLSNGNYSVNSTFSLYGILAEGVSPTTKATGGAVYSDSTYYYHVFGASGTFTPTQSITADYIVVAGGGGGGGTTGGGGGAGGFYSTTLASLSATNYSITVGAGGAGGTNNGTSGSAGSKGSDSSFNSITRTGGGGGGTSPNIPTYAATTGGSGGGGSRSGSSQPGAAGNQGAYTPVEGYAGGNNFTGGGVYGTGGGGGAGAAGQSGTSTTDGAGGIGATSGLITAIVKATGNGELVLGTGYIAGGGGGACGDAASITNFGAPGGLGGGGKGGSDLTLSSSVNGKSGTGSGGGGSAYISGYLSGARGGSGVVVIRYAK